jgi:eukaryotic-like serine/threonine-protein kinase
VKQKSKKVLSRGARLSSHLTVIDAIDGGSPEPVYLVWSHKEWCPIVCKIMDSPEHAEHEALVMSYFSHQNIARTFGVSEQIYLLMPYIPGTSLSAGIDAAPHHRLSVSDSMRLAIHIGAALIHIHNRGYLHMDVKPDNIIVGADGRPTLFDFGCARKICAARPPKVIGTNLYIAPEECRLGSPGTGADVFSFSVMLYEMLGGEFPFGRSTREAPFPQLKNDATPIRQHRAALPRALENLLQACLERNPAFRPELAEIMPLLHTFIDSGARMWPIEIEPGQAVRANGVDAKPAAANKPPVENAPLHDSKVAPVLLH